MTNSSLNSKPPINSDAGPVLTIEGATFGYDERPLWSDLNLDVRHGEFIAIIGSNGSGKTSLLRAILGQEQLTRGTIKLNGKPISAGSLR